MKTCQYRDKFSITANNYVIIKPIPILILYDKLGGFGYISKKEFDWL